MVKIQQEVDKVDFKGISKQVESSGISQAVGKAKQIFSGATSSAEEYKVKIQETTAQERLLIHEIQEKQKLLQNYIPKEDPYKSEKYLEAKKQGVEPIFMDTGQVLKAEAEIEKLQNKLYKLQTSKTNVDVKVNADNIGGIDNKVVSWKTILTDGAKGIGQSFKNVGKQIFNVKNIIGTVGNAVNTVKSKISGISQAVGKIKSGFKGVGGSVKQGIGHVLKYAWALLSIRGIYSALSGAAHAWLGSQNAEAKQLSANLDYMKYAVGSALAPIIEGIVNLIYQALKGIQSMIYALTGVNIFAKASSKSYASMAKSAKKTKEETKQLAGIHSDINNIQSNNSSGSGDSGASTPSFDLSKLDTANSFINKIKNGDWFSIGQDIGKKVNETLEKIPWDKIRQTATNIGTNLASFLNGAIDGIDWNLLGYSIAQGFNTAVDFAYSFVTTFDFRKFGTSIGTGVQSAFDNYDWAKAGKTVGESIKGIFNTISGFIQAIDWGQLARNVCTYIRNIDWSGVSKSLFEALGSALGALGSFIGQLILDAFKGIEGYFSEKIEECGGNVIEGFFKGIGDALANIGQWIVDNIFNPFIDGFKKAFNIHSPSKVMEEQGKFIIQGLLNGIKSLLGNISTIWETIKSTAIEKFENIRNGIAEKWENIKTATSEKWEYIKGKVSETAENIKNGVQEKFGQAKEKASEIWNNAKTTIGSKWDEMKTKASNISETIKGTISNKFNEAKGNLGTAFEGMKNNLTTSLNNMKNNAGTLGNNVVSGLKNSLGNLGEKAKTWGSDMIQGFTNGINKAKSSISNAVKSVGNTIKNFLHFSRPDMGPLRDYETWMPDMIQGLTRTLNSKAPELYNATHLLAEKISDNFNIPILSGVNIPTMNKLISQPDLVSTAPKIQNTNLSNYFYEGQSDEGRPIRIVLNYFGKEVFDETIDYINDKTRRTGKDTIITIDR